MIRSRNGVPGSEIRVYNSLLEEACRILNKKRVILLVCVGHCLKKRISPRLYKLSRRGISVCRISWSLFEFVGTKGTITNLLRIWGWMCERLLQMKIMITSLVERWRRVLRAHWAWSVRVSASSKIITFGGAFPASKNRLCIRLSTKG